MSVGLFVAAIGILVSVGWSFDITFLKSILPKWRAMPPAAALGFILSGCSLYCFGLAWQGRTWLRRISQICALCVALFGLFKLGHYIFGWSMNFDMLGFHDPANVSFPTRMSQLTAVDFLLLGGALLLAGRSGFSRLFQIFVISATLIGWLGFLRYLYGGEPLLSYGQMAVHTSVLLIILSGGILCTRPDAGLMVLLMSDSEGGKLARRMLLPTLLVPFLITFLESLVDRTGWFNPDAQSSLFTILDIIIFGGLVWFNAALLHRADMEHRRATQERNRLAHIVEDSEDAIISKDLDGIITSWNRGAEKVFGYSAQEAIGKSMLMLFPPDRVEEEPKILERIRRGEDVSHFETVRVTKSGKLIDVSVTISPLMEGDKIIGASKIARDITDRKEAERSLKLFRMLIDNSSDGIEVIDPVTGRLLDINERTCERLGYSREELLSMNVMEIDPIGINSNIWRRHIEETRKIGFKIIEGVHRRKDGSTFPIEVNVRYVQSDRDYLIAVIRDITERKRAEEELRANRAKLETALASMTDAVFISDNKGRFIEFNDAFATFHKFKSKEECAKNLADYPAILEVFTDGELTPLEQWAVPRALRGETRTNVEHTLRRKDTGETWVGSYSFAPVRDKSGAIVGSVVVGRDITERKRADEEIKIQLEELQRWHEAMLGREDRILELKREVNELLIHGHQTARYSDFSTS